MRIYTLNALTEEEIGTLLRRAAGADIDVEQNAVDFLAARCEGDARIALNALELAAETAQGAPVTLELAQDALQRRAVLYDKGGDRHYDYISAWIKATRGSDPDASLYYLAVMLEGGEDPRFIVRRMIILASEDIGNADPAALSRRDRGRRRGRARRPARGALRARADRHLPVARAQVRRRRARPVGRTGARARARRRPRPGPAALRAAPGADPRRLREPPPQPRPRQLGAAARRVRRRARASTCPTRPRRQLAERLERIRRARGLSGDNPSR